MIPACQRPGCSDEALTPSNATHQRIRADSASGIIAAEPLARDFLPSFIIVEYRVAVHLIYDRPLIYERPSRCIDILDRASGSGA